MTFDTLVAIMREDTLTQRIFCLSTRHCLLSKFERMLPGLMLMKSFSTFCESMKIQLSLIHSRHVLENKRLGRARVSFPLLISLPAIILSVGIHVARSGAKDKDESSTPKRRKTDQSKSDSKGVPKGRPFVSPKVPSPAKTKPNPSSNGISTLKKNIATTKTTETRGSALDLQNIPVSLFCSIDLCNYGAILIFLNY